MSEWQPIETAPKDGTRILAFFPQQIDCYTILTVNFTRDQWALCPYGGYDFCSIEFGETEDPTHWMPLPNPPKQEKEIA